MAPWLPSYHPYGLHLGAEHDNHTALHRIERLLLRPYDEQPEHEAQYYRQATLRTLGLACLAPAHMALVAPVHSSTSA